MRKHIFPLVICLAAALLFLFISLYLVEGLLPYQVFLPGDIANDEVFYNRQLAGVMKYGQPQGVFGYNESKALVGHFGYWGPLVILLYAIPGLLVGGGYNAMFRCNIIFALTGWTVYVLLAKIDWRRQLLFGAFLLFSTAPLMYVFSGFSETFHHAIYLALLALTHVSLKKDSVPLYIGQFLLCGLAGIIRPDELVFWLLPLVVAVFHKRKLWSAACVAGGVCSVVCCALQRKFFCAEYIGEGLNTAPFSSLLSGDFIAFGAEVREIANNFIDYIFFHKNPEYQAIFTPGSGREYWVLMILFVAVVAALIYDAVHKRPLVLKACSLVIGVLIFLALFFLYNPIAGERHLVLLYIGFFAALLLEDWQLAASSLVVLAVVFFAYGCWGNLGFRTASYDAAMDAEMTTLHTALTEDLAANPSDDPWDLTLAYSLYDSVNHGFLYAVPAGMGIQFDECTAYLTYDVLPIHSRYVMTRPGGGCVGRLEADGWTVLVQTEHCLIYKHPR